MCSLGKRYVLLSTAPSYRFADKLQAYSEHIIRRKILEKVATFSTWPDFVDNNQTPDSDVVVTTQSDADSSGESKVVASSVKGEDDLVEVSMKEENWKPSVNGVLRDFSKKRPEWIDPQRMLPPQLQNMFELSYFCDRSEVVPSGWNQVQDRQEYPKLSSRAPEDSSSDHDTSGPSPLTNGGDSDAESTSDKQSVTDAAAPTRMNDESSEEDEPSRPVKVRNSTFLCPRICTFTPKAHHPGTFPYPVCSHLTIFRRQSG